VLRPDTYDEGDANMSSEDDEHDVLIRCTQGEVAKFSAKVCRPVKLLCPFFHPCPMSIKEVRAARCSLIVQIDHSAYDSKTRQLMPDPRFTPDRVPHEIRITPQILPGSTHAQTRQEEGEIEG